MAGLKCHCPILPAAAGKVGNAKISWDMGEGPFGPGGLPRPFPLAPLLQARPRLQAKPVPMQELAGYMYPYPATGPDWAQCRLLRGRGKAGTPLQGASRLSCSAYPLPHIYSWGYQNCRRFKLPLGCTAVNQSPIFLRAPYRSASWYPGGLYGNGRLPYAQHLPALPSSCPYIPAFDSRRPHKPYPGPPGHRRRTCLHWGRWARRSPRGSRSWGRRP